MKPAQLLALTLLLGLLSLSACNSAFAQADPAQLAAAEDEDEEDEEEEAVNYRDKVREIQQWMNRRDSERKGEAPTLDVAPAPPAYPRYFRDNNTDAGGYRRLDREVRARLSDAPQDYTPRRHARPRHHYHYRAWHKRWHRHVRPVVLARHHHYRSRHAAKGWHPHESHGSHPAAKHGHAALPPAHGKHGRAAEVPAHGKHAAKAAPPPRPAAKPAPPARHAAAKAPAKPAKAAPAKSAPKKGRGKR